MESYIRIKLNPATQEIDFEVPTSHWEQFAHLILPSIEKFNERLKDNVLPVIASQAPSPEPGITSETPRMFESFGELLHHLTSSKDVDKVLLAGYFLQSKTSSKDFSSQEVTALLKEHGHSPSNTSAFITQNNVTKKIFKVSGNRFRVSANGVTYLNEILK